MSLQKTYLAGGQQAGNAGGIHERRAHHLDRVNDARLDQVLELACFTRVSAQRGAHVLL